MTNERGKWGLEIGNSKLETEGWLEQLVIDPFVIGLFATDGCGSGGKSDVSACQNWQRQNLAQRHVIRRLTNWHVKRDPRGSTLKHPHA